MNWTGKSLLRLDRCFALPQRLMEFVRQRIGKLRRNPSEQVVVIKYMGMGSLIHFASRCGDFHVDKSKITLLTLSRHRDLCRQLGFENTLFIRTKNPFSFVLDCGQAIVAIQALRPSCIVDLEKCSRAAGAYLQTLALLTQSHSISFESKRSVSNSLATVFDVETLTQEEIFLKALEKLPQGLDDQLMEDSTRINPNKIIVNINASAYLLARRYPIISFIELIRSLHHWNPDLNFFLSGTPEEFNYVEELRADLHGLPVHNVSGKWSLEKFTQELSDCALFITGDSGPLHLAVHLQIPTVAIWGPTQPQHFGYQDKVNLSHATLNLSCSPCMRHPDSDPAQHCRGKISCMQNLPPASVFEKSIAILTAIPQNRIIHWPAGVTRKASTEAQLV